MGSVQTPIQFFKTWGLFKPLILFHVFFKIKNNTWSISWGLSRPQQTGVKNKNYVKLKSDLPIKFNLFYFIILFKKSVFQSKSRFLVFHDDVTSKPPDIIILFFNSRVYFCTKDRATAAFLFS